MIRAHLHEAAGLRAYVEVKGMNFSLMKKNLNFILASVHV